MNSSTWMDVDAVKKTVDKHCANMESGHRCLLMDGKPCLYFRDVVNRCNYAEDAVLPNDAAVEAEYHERMNRHLGNEDSTQQDTTADCQDCGKPYVRRSNRQTRCPSCQVLADRRSKAARQRRYRQVRQNQG